MNRPPTGERQTDRPADQLGPLVGAEAFALTRIDAGLAYPVAHRLINQTEAAGGIGDIDGARKQFLRPVQFQLPPIWAA